MWSSVGGLNRRPGRYTNSGLHSPAFHSFGVRWNPQNVVLCWRSQPPSRAVYKYGAPLAYPSLVWGQVESAECGPLFGGLNRRPGRYTNTVLHSPTFHLSGVRWNPPNVVLCWRSQPLSRAVYKYAAPLTYPSFVWGQVESAECGPLLEVSPPSRAVYKYGTPAVSLCVTRWSRSCVL